MGSKPCFILQGDVFHTEGKQPESPMAIVGNFLVDFFRGQTVDHVNLAGLDHVIVLTAQKIETQDANSLPYKLLFRQYRILMKRSGTKVSHKYSFL